MTQIIRLFLVGVWVRIFFMVCLMVNPVEGAGILVNPIVFVKQTPVSFTFATISDTFGNFLGYEPEVYQPVGGNLFRLDPDGTLTNLTNLSNAAVRNPEVSFDGNKIIFSMKTGGTGKWQIYEINVDGSNLRKISQGGSNDLDPAYLPDGNIVFSSGRLRIGDRYDQLPTAQLFKMDSNGNNVVQLSISPAGDFSPGIRSNGEIYFTRWDLFIPDRQNESKMDVNRFLLWRMNPDGTSDGHPIYGTHTINDFSAMLYGRELKDGSGRFVAAFVPLFFTFGSGALVLIDPDENANDEEPIFLTPISGFTKGAGHTSGRYRDPHPMKDGRILAAYASGAVYSEAEEPNSGPVPDFEIVVVNPANGTRTSIYNDPAFWELEPVEAVSSPSIPPVIASVRDPSKDFGILSSKDVYNRGFDYDADEFGPDQPIPARGTAKSVKIYRGNFSLPNPEFPDYPIVEKEFLLETPVEEDGSFAAKVPPLTPLIWELYDTSGNLLVVERFWNQVVPGEVKECNGCHSPHDGTLGSTENIALKKLLAESGLFPEVPAVRRVGFFILLTVFSLFLLRTGKKRVLRYSMFFLR